MSTKIPYLKAGDTIGIVSTARKITLEEIAPALKLIESWGLKTKLGKNLFKVERQFAGTDAERAADLQEMMDDAEIKAVIFARGGYGTVRIIDMLDFSRFCKSPKWLCGYSDITVLHHHLHQNFGIPTIHSVMLSGFYDNGVLTENATESLRKALFGEELSYTIPAGPNAKLQRAGSAEGILAGGNLSLLYALSGSVSDLSTDGKILFIEDLDEYLYHIDRMMLQLKRSGKLSKLKGLIVGGMSDMKDNAIPFGRTAEEIVAETVAEYDYPVCFDFPAGHIGDNRALRMGVRVSVGVGVGEIFVGFERGNS